jgi:hypothetical protein
MISALLGAIIALSGFFIGCKVAWVLGKIINNPPSRPCNEFLLAIRPIVALVVILEIIIWIAQLDIFQQTAILIIFSALGCIAMGTFLCCLCLTLYCPRY